MTDISLAEKVEGLDPAGWLSIADHPPPKDGTVILLSWFDNGRPQEWFAMQWGHIKRNGLFPGKVGMWMTPDGSLTWADDDPHGAPTHWKHEPAFLRANGASNGNA